MKKTNIIFFLLLTSLCLTSCKEKKESDLKEPGETKPKAENVNIKNLTSLDIVADKSLFTSVKEDQSWSFETDMNPNCIPSKGIADTGDAVYINNQSILICLPKSESIAEIACDKEKCSHLIYSPPEQDCESYLSIQYIPANGLQYYEGNLYYTIKDGGIALYKMSLNRKEKWFYAMLSDNTDCMSDEMFPWLIHRGYIYFWNETEGISRVSVDNPGIKQQIISRQDGTYHKPVLKAYGSYLYFMLPGAGKEDSVFGRYNTESGQIENFSQIREKLSDFIVKEDKIYYQKSSDNIIYQYDISSGQNEVYFELESKEYSFYTDTDYIYLPKANRLQESCDSGYYGYYEVTADVYTWDKVFVGNVPLMKKTHEEKMDIVASDSDRIYYHRTAYNGARTFEAVIYVNKSKISENKTNTNISFEYAADY